MDWPVVIVGCGPVGMTLGNLLGTLGIPALILERERQLMELPRAVGVDRDCLRAWQAADLDGALLADMNPMGEGGLGMVYLDPNGRPFLEVRPDDRKYGFAFGYGFIQPIADRILLEGLARFEKLEVRFANRVEAVEQDAEIVRLQVRQGDGTQHEIRARYVVTCDGGQSDLRRLLGIAMPGTSHTERWLIVDSLEMERPNRDIGSVEIFCDPDRPSVSVPRKYGHRRWEFRLRSDEKDVDLLSEERIRELLTERGVSKDTEILRKLVYRFNARLAERFREGRIFLAGDAAHVTPPFAAQGLAMGIRDVFNLAWKLALVLQRKAPSSLLDSYEIERRPQARATIRLATWLGRIMMPRSRLRAHAAPLAIRLLNRVPAFRRAIRNGGPKPRPRLHGDTWLRSRGRNRMAGEWLHQPNVSDSSGRRDKLDRFLGSGFALLGWGVDPLDGLDPDVRAALDRLGTCAWRLQPAGSTVKYARTLTDDEGDWQRWLGPPTRRVFLVRPDRFVAADLDVSDASDGLRRILRRYLQPEFHPAS